MSDVSQFSVACTRVEASEPHVTFHHSRCMLKHASLKDWREYRAAVRDDIRAIEADLLAWATSGA